jgi:hypothetical protein
MEEFGEFGVNQGLREIKGVGKIEQIEQIGGKKTKLTRKKIKLN